MKSIKKNKENKYKLLLTYPSTLKHELLNRIDIDTSLNVNTYLPKYLYVIHILYWGRSNSMSYDEKGISINMKNLKELLGVTNSVASKIINDLIDWDYIIKVSEYSVKITARSYKLHDSINHLPVNPNLIVSTRKNSFIYRVLAEREKQFRKLSPNESYQLEILNNDITLSEEALDYLSYKYPSHKFLFKNNENQPLEEIKGLSIPREDLILFSILFKEFFVYRPEEGNRLYHNLSSLKKEYRNFLLMDGLPMFNTDITNSQVVYGTFLIEDKLNDSKNGTLKSRLPQDFLNFKRLVLSGKIYEYLDYISCYGVPSSKLSDHRKTINLNINDFLKMDYRLENKVRGLFKKRFFKFIWYGRTPKNPKRFYQLFRSAFPSVLDVIESIKFPDFTVFPKELQKLEAKMMIDNVAEKLRLSGIKFLSIHDSFLLNNIDDVEKVKQNIAEAFIGKYNVSPWVKVEGRKVRKVTSTKWKPTPMYMHDFFFDYMNKLEVINLRTRFKKKNFLSNSHVNSK